MPTGRLISSLTSPGTAQDTDTVLAVRSGGGIVHTALVLAQYVAAYIADATLTLTNKTLVAPALGTPASGNLTNCTGGFRATSGLGYATGGTVTQLTSKSTAVTLDTLSGRITLNNAALAAATNVSFTLTNSQIEANDIILMNHLSAGTANAYLLNAQAGIGSASINVRNITAGSLSEAIVIAFNVYKGATT